MKKFLTYSLVLVSQFALLPSIASAQMLGSSTLGSNNNSNYTQSGNQNKNGMLSSSTMSSHNTIPTGNTQHKNHPETLSTSNNKAHNTPNTSGVFSSFQNNNQTLSTTSTSSTYSGVKNTPVDKDITQQAISEIARAESQKYKNLSIKWQIRTSMQRMLERNKIRAKWKYYANRKYNNR